MRSCRYVHLSVSPETTNSCAEPTSLGLRTGRAISRAASASSTTASPRRRRVASAGRNETSTVLWAGFRALRSAPEPSVPMNSVESMPERKVMLRSQVKAKSHGPIHLFGIPLHDAIFKVADVRQQRWTRRAQAGHCILDHWLPRTDGVEEVRVMGLLFRTAPRTLHACSAVPAAACKIGGSGYFLRLC